MQNKMDLQSNFVDRPDLDETFADSIRSLTFDGQTMRIMFCTTRLDQPKQTDQPLAKQYPVCRLVLTPPAVVDLFNKLQQLMSVMEQSGVIKKESIPPRTVQ
ncbi:MAG: hypothetical protein EHM45_15130 [Desulfobacteraceae bacterium]|nr:MAG: hypothetical protein EHM45_15130 [Desulfobacteraceae bacterium]